MLNRLQSGTDFHSPLSNRQKPMDETMKSGMNVVDEVGLRTEDNSVDLFSPVASSELTLHLNQTFQKVREVRFSVFTVHNSDFCALEEEHERSHGEFPVENLNFVLKDPPELFVAFKTMRTWGMTD